MKQYTIIGGINGVGKSSLSGVLRHQLPDMGLIIDPNVIVSKESCDRLTAGKLALARVENCLQKGINFSQETTLSGRRTIRTIQQAREKNYHIRLYYVGVSGAEESLFRIANRVRKGRHNIPKQDVLRRYEKRFADLAEVLPYCDEVHFYDNENGFREVALYQSGEIMPLVTSPPQWLRDLWHGKTMSRHKRKPPRSTVTSAAVFCCILSVLSCAFETSAHKFWDSSIQNKPHSNRETSRNCVAFRWWSIGDSNP